MLLLLLLILGVHCLQERQSCNKNYDITNDGKVGIDDLAYLLTNWGPCPPGTECICDLDCNGVVNVDDLVLILVNYGKRIIKCDGNITLPQGFCATIVADLMMDNKKANARHITINPDGDIFVAINNNIFGNPSFGIIGLRDTNKDGKADIQTQFSPGVGGNGIVWYNGYLYFATNTQVLRYQIQDLQPVGEPVVIVSNLPDSGDHVTKSIVIHNDLLYVSIGSESNSCQYRNRAVESPGIYPCPELYTRGGIWRYILSEDHRNGNNLDGTNGIQYATGIRNMVAINMFNNELYGVQHGRDMLNDNWPQLYTDLDNSFLPSEEFVKISQNSNLGWPYCYYDYRYGKVVSPEYNTVKSSINCTNYTQPLAIFGAHWAPNGLHFYTGTDVVPGGTKFPLKYQGGAFIAFHGGYDRAPYPNEGYNVMFTKGSIKEVFADGFANSNNSLPATAQHRPVGITEFNGDLYVSDDAGGRIYKITYTGN